MEGGERRARVPPTPVSFPDLEEAEVRDRQTGLGRDWWIPRPEACFLRCELRRRGAHREVKEQVQDGGDHREVQLQMRGLELQSGLISRWGKRGLEIKFNHMVNDVINRARIPQPGKGVKHGKGAEDGVRGVCVWLGCNCLIIFPCIRCFIVGIYLLWCPTLLLHFLGEGSDPGKTVPLGTVSERCSVPVNSFSSSASHALAIICQ